MGTRGKSSVADRAVVALVGPAARMAAPNELTPAQADIWRQIVATKPAQWFTPDASSLLVAYCRAITDAEVIDAAIQAFNTDSIAQADGLARFGKLMHLREKNATSQKSLATAMRLTQQSRYQAKSAATAADHTVAGTKPWQRSA